MTLRVAAVGPLATIQDLGRPGHASVGVSAGGAADRGALALANRLVGNDPGALAVEVLLGALVLVAESPVVVAVAGAPVPVLVDGRVVDAGGPLTMRPGQVLALGQAEHGLRSYVAVRGGVVAPLLFGSASSDPVNGLGPPPLQVGDVIATGPATGGEPAADGGSAAYRWGGVVEARVVLGPRDDWFTTEAVRTLLAARWEVTSDLDRVGTRLAGPHLERSLHGELASEGLVRGSVQVPASGQPLVFGADHPTTGGYPVIAVVLDADLDRLGQLRPGDHVRFTRVPPPWS